jgi:hypothetical protein
MGEEITALADDILSFSDVLLLSMSLELLRSPSLLSYIISNKPEIALYLSVLTAAYCGNMGHGVP